MARNSPIPPHVRNPEQRLISEYLVARFPDVRHATRVPLGPEIDGLPPSLDRRRALRASRPWRPEVDAVVYWDGVLLLVEGKVKELLNGLAKLPFYRDLVGSTPELEPYRGWEVRMRLVTPRASAAYRLMAESAGVEVDVYEPDWMVEYWEWRDRYWTAEWRRARDELRRRRAVLGVE